MSDKRIPSIPYDMYESPQEVIIILPLGWVKKESIEVKIENYRIFIHWERLAPQLKESCIPIQEECYRWPIELQIEIPPQVYFDRIHSKLTLDNTLQIIVPKALVPDKIELEVQYEDEK